MKKLKIYLPTIIFLLLTMLSAYLCTEYREQRYVFYYAMAIPSMVGLFISILIVAFMTINNDKR